MAHPGLRKRFNRTALCGGAFQNPTNVLLFSYVQKLMAQAPRGLLAGRWQGMAVIEPKSRDLKNAGQPQSVAGRQCTIPRHFSLPSPQPRLHLALSWHRRWDIAARPLGRPLFALTLSSIIRDSKSLKKQPFFMNDGC